MIRKAKATLKFHGVIIIDDEKRFGCRFFKVAARVFLE